LEPIYWAALFSFIVGACGYIIIRFWIVPISKYRGIKRRLIEGLNTCVQKLPDEDASVRWKQAAGSGRLRDLRRLGVKLVDLHNGDLPYWYRLVLLTRKESPLDMIELLLRLDNMANSGNARQCIDEIIGHLAVKKPDTPSVAE